MRPRPCSHCGQWGRLLDAVNFTADVYYYRCDTCGQVWMIDEDSPDAEPRIVAHPIKL